MNTFSRPVAARSAVILTAAPSSAAPSSEAPDDPNNDIQVMAAPSEEAPESSDPSSTSPSTAAPTTGGVTNNRTSQSTGDYVPATGEDTALNMSLAVICLVISATFVIIAVSRKKQEEE